MCKRVHSPGRQGPGSDRGPSDRSRLAPLRVRLTDNGGAECVGQQRQPVVVGLLQGVHRPGPGPRVQQQPLQLSQHLQPALPLALAVRQQQHGARGGRHGQLGGRHLRWVGGEPRLEGRAPGASSPSSRPSVHR